MKKRAATVMILVAGALAGCVEKQGPRLTPETAPKFTLQELVTKVEQNTANLTRYRSTGGSLSGRIPTDKGLKNYDLGGVAVLYECPRRLYLAGNMAGQPAVQIGSNDQTYWLGILKDPSQIHWGYWKFANLECNTWKTTGPQKLIEALGRVSLRPAGPAEGPDALAGPVLQRRDEGNVLVYTATTPEGRAYCAKEVVLSFDEPIRITRIVYHDPDGADQLVITFSDFRSFGEGAWMAQKVELNWPRNNGYMKLRLRNINPGASLNSEAFVMPDFGSYSEVFQVDSECQ